MNPRSTDEPGYVRTIIGFDLGHGETSLAKLPPGAHEPEVLGVPQAGDHFPTVLAVYADEPGHEVPVAERIRIGRVLGGSVEEFYIAFKSPDLTDPRMVRGTELFVSQIQLLLHGGVGGTSAAELPPGTPVQWIFGVPSGWREEVREEYRELLAALCGDDVLVVPESRAAMHYAYYSRDIVKGPDAGRALVIDLGSSTADYTVVSGLVADSYAWDDGTTVGASLIDKEIVRRTIAAYKQRPGSDPGLLDEFLQSATYQGLLELHCRAAKEDFFRGLPPASQIHRYPPVDRAARLHNEKTGENIKVDIELTPQLMTEIFATPLPELDKTWGEAFRQDLRAIRAKLRDEAPAAIVMTGGASRMVYAQEAVEEVFPESRVVLGTEPQFAIAKGLAIVGRKQEDVARFRKDFAVYVNGPDIPEMIDAKVTKLATELGAIMSAGLVEDHMIPATLKWRDDELDTIADIEGEVQRTYKGHLHSPAVSKKLRAAVERWTADVTRDIDQQTRKICERAGIPADMLSISHRPELDQHVRADSELATRMALDIYDQIGNWMVGAVSVIAGLAALIAAAVAFDAAAVALAAAAATGAAASFWNPWLITALAVAVAGGAIAGAVAGKQKAMETIRTKRISPKIRRMVGEDSLRAKIRGKAKVASPEADLAEKVAARFLARNAETIQLSLLNEVRGHLNTAADRAELFIRPTGRVIPLGDG